MNLGEVFSDKQTTETGSWIKTIADGKVDQLLSIPPQWMENVKDSARLHLSALLDPRVGNERILAFAEPFNWNDILAVLRKLYPERRFSDDVPDLPRDLSTVDHSRGVQLLKAFGRDGFTSLEETVRESMESMKAA